MAEILNLSPREMQLYEESMRRCWEVESMIESNFKAGRLDGARSTFLLMASNKLGPVPADIEASVNSLRDLNTVHSLLELSVGASDWESLRAPLRSITKRKSR